MTAVTARSFVADIGKPSRAPGGSGSGSDTDTSRATRPRVKLMKTSPPGSPPNQSPNRSRAASPVSRTGTPEPNSGLAPPKKDYPTLEEVRAAIPPDGIEIKALMAAFKLKVGGRTTDFINLVKAAGTQDKTTGKIKPKVEAEKK